MNKSNAQVSLYHHKFASVMFQAIEVGKTIFAISHNSLSRANSLDRLLPEVMTTPKLFYKLPSRHNEKYQASYGV